MFKAGIMFASLALVVPWGERQPLVVADCDIAGIYEEVVPDHGTLAITSLGEAEEVEALLVPIRVDTGRYRVTVSRRASNLYEAQGVGLYFRTRYCYEYATYQEVIVEVTGVGGFTVGNIEFTTAW